MQGVLVTTPHSWAQLPSGCRALAHNLIKSLEQPCDMVMTVPTPQTQAPLRGASSFMSPEAFKLGWILEGKEYTLEYTVRYCALGRPM